MALTEQAATRQAPGRVSASRTPWAMHLAIVATMVAIIVVALLQP